MVKFSEMQYQRPDLEGLKKVLEDATARVINAKDYQEVRKAYFDVQEKRTETGTLVSIAYVRNTINTAD